MFLVLLSGCGEDHSSENKTLIADPPKEETITKNINIYQPIFIEEKNAPKRNLSKIETFVYQELFSLKKFPTKRPPAVSPLLEETLTCLKEDLNGYTINRIQNTELFPIRNADGFGNIYSEESIKMLSCLKDANIKEHSGAFASAVYPNNEEYVALASIRYSQGFTQSDYSDCAFIKDIDIIDPEGEYDKAMFLICGNFNQLKE